jgi:hypothetical protein
MIGIDQIRSSVFFQFLGPSSTYPIFSKAHQACLTIRTLQWLLDSINSFRFVPVPSLTFSLFSHLDYLQ